MKRLSYRNGNDQGHAEIDIADFIPNLDDSTILGEDQLRDLSQNITNIIPRTGGVYDVEGKTYR